MPAFFAPPYFRTFRQPFTLLNATARRLQRWRAKATTLQVKPIIRVSRHACERQPAMRGRPLRRLRLGKRGPSNNVSAGLSACAVSRAISERASLHHEPIIPPSLYNLPDDKKGCADGDDLMSTLTCWPHRWRSNATQRNAPAPVTFDVDESPPRRAFDRLSRRRSVGPVLSAYRVNPCAANCKVAEISVRSISANTYPERWQPDWLSATGSSGKGADLWMRLPMNVSRPADCRPSLIDLTES